MTNNYGGYEVRKSESGRIYESDVEEFVVSLLEKQGYDYLSPEQWEIERGDLSNVVLKDRLRQAIDSLNPNIPPEAKEQALREVLNLSSHHLIENNEIFYNMLTDGVSVEYRRNGNIVGDRVRLIDFYNPYANNLVVANQYTVIENNRNKRPDVVLFVNGLPLVVIELKNPTDEKATVYKAFTQLNNYKTAIPALFNYNGILVASDGLDAKAGSLTAGWEWFMAWKTVDGVKEDSATTPQIETLIKGMLRPNVFLDLVRHFTVFTKTKHEDEKTGLTTVETVKKIAAYHQYHAVNKAVDSTLRAIGHNTQATEHPSLYGLPSVDQQKPGDHKAGVIWHTQGSGKSLSMVFYTGKLIVEPAMKNPTIVVITDRNDLDDQLFDTFASSQQLLRQEPVQAQSRSDLKRLLKTAGGGIIFTTIQKFFPEDNHENFDLLSKRDNIVVIADEAHRSQYGFGAKIHIKNGQAFTRYGFAKYLRDALPNASFIGFTGTPIEKEDASTPAVFGHYIDIYDIEQAVEDGATVPIYYESRLVKLHLKEEEKEKLDDEVLALTEQEESVATERAKSKWSRLEAIVGDHDRLATVAQDIVRHFEARQQVFEGKGMIVTMSRRIAVDLYNEIIKLRPEWHSENKHKGVIKVVMTSSSSDPADWQMHHTTKEDRRKLADRLKDPHDSLKLVIVRDMWLTGFDAPILHTMYIDKPMRGHTLMQAIARVNRVYKDKPGGLIVDYIGIASDLKQALTVYTESGGKGKPILDRKEAITLMLEKHEIVTQMFAGFDYERYFSANTRDKMTIILEAQDHILGLEDGKNRFVKQVTALSKAFALATPSPEAMRLNAEIGFFQAVKARLIKLEPTDGSKSDYEIESAIKQIVDQAVVSEGVIDVFSVAGLKKPDISILSDEFLAEVKGMKQKNVALELLRKLLNDEIRAISRRNMVQGKKLSEMLKATLNKYHSNVLTAAEVIQELIQMAKEMRQLENRGKDLGLSEDEIAFYDALAVNESARQVLGDDTLRELAQLLVQKVKANTTIDWTIKENVRAKLRVIVKRLLRQYGYPPDKQKLATENILKQAELLAQEWIMV